MQLNPQDFIVFDIAAFPLVGFNQQAVQPGYAEQWQQEMMALLLNGKSFVVLYDHMRVEETRDDRQQRGDWLICHRVPLSQVCKGMISIESDTERAETLQKVRKMFGIPHQVVSSRPYALALMRQWTQAAAS